MIFISDECLLHILYVYLLLGGCLAKMIRSKVLLFSFIFVQVLKEEPTYPEALIGRGTAYAFQRELESAIADFTKVFIYLTKVVTIVG